MNTMIKMTALPVMLLSLMYAPQAFADALGDKLADAVCWSLQSGQTYTLSKDDDDNWKGKTIQGTKSYVNGAQTVTGEFNKPANQDPGTCATRTTYSSTPITCSYHLITKRDKVLTMGPSKPCGGAQAPLPLPGFFSKIGHNCIQYAGPFTLFMIQLLITDAGRYTL
jgi:hypothetical protein